MGADSDGDCSSLGDHSKFKGYSHRANPPATLARDTQKFLDPSCPATRLMYFFLFTDDPPYIFDERTCQVVASWVFHRIRPLCRFGKRGIHEN